MGRLSKKLLSLVTTVTVMSTIFVNTSVSVNTNASTLNNDSNEVTTNTSSNNYNLPDKISEGMIFHAWNWSFNNIKEALKDIAESGFNTIQTSPVQACRLGASWNNADKTNTNSNPSWYYLYQPTYFTVGNEYLGSEDEFKSLCEEAHRYGIKIVVDVVANHLADCGTQNADKVDSTLYNEARRMDNGGHRIGGTAENPIPDDWKNRNSVTQGCCIGMPDINTASSKSQDIINGYVEKLLDDGADGLRFDAAKSIELPSQYEENGNSSSDFWPNIINKAKAKNPDVFIYGEVLQGDEPGTNFNNYTKVMNVTGSTYGWHIRSAVGYEMWQYEKDGKDVLGGNNNGIVEPHTDTIGTTQYAAGNGEPTGSITNDKLVCWVESHDLYANAGATRCMTPIQREMAWAMIAARADMVGLFFNRPVDTDFGSNPMNPQGEAYKTMGERGCNDFMSKNIVAVNKFHNAMVGEKENISSECGNKVFKVQRGNKGLVLINVDKNNSQNINLDTSLPDGTYTNTAESGGEFKVSNGKVTGNMPASSIAVLYKAEDEPVKEVKITANPSSGTFEDSQDVKLTLENADNGTYKVKEDSKEIESGDFKNGETITIGKEAKEGSTITLEVTAGDKTETYTYEKNAASIMESIKADPSEGEFKDSIKVKLELLELSNGKYVVTEDENELESGTFKDGDEIEIGKDAKEGSTITLTLTADEGNKVTYTYKKSKTEVGDLSVELNASKTKAIIGETIDLEAISSNSDVTYKYNVTKPNGKKVTLDNEEGKTSLKVSLEGTYSVNVTVTDADGNSATDSVEIVVTKKEQEENKKLEIVSIEADVESGKLEAGKSTYITTTTKNSIDDVYYKYYINNTAVTEWVNDPQYKWTPDEEGTYTIQVKVKDSRNEIATKSIEYKVIKATEEESSVVINDVTISPKEIKAGDKVSIIVDAEGNGELLYKYEIKDKDEKVIDSSSKYGNENEFVVQIDSEGEYTLTVYVKDESQNEPVQKVVKLNVEKKNDDQSSEEGTGEHNGFGMLAGLLSVSAIALFSTKRKEN